MSELSETLIVRSKASNTLYDVVEIDNCGDIVNFLARNTTFEKAQNILEAVHEQQQNLLQ